MFITHSVFRGLNLFRSQLNLCKSCNHLFRFHHSHSLSKKINFGPILLSYKYSLNNGLFGKFDLSTASRLYQKDVVDNRMKNLIVHIIKLCTISSVRYIVAGLSFNV